MEGMSMNSSLSVTEDPLDDKSVDSQSPSRWREGLVRVKYAMDQSPHIGLVWMSSSSINHDPKLRGLSPEALCSF
ncbi:hypothetical protein TNCV_3185711 [Trichonephila clavipes]|nr:hypothetical protein TNCV_3185711 [Trichonephila clavipes]